MSNSSPPVRTPRSLHRRSTRWSLIRYPSLRAGPPRARRLLHRRSRSPRCFCPCSSLRRSAPTTPSCATPPSHASPCSSMSVPHPAAVAVAVAARSRRRRTRNVLAQTWTLGLFSSARPLPVRTSHRLVAFIVFWILPHCWMTLIIISIISRSRYSSQYSTGSHAERDHAVWACELFSHSLLLFMPVVCEAFSCCLFFFFLYLKYKYIFPP
mmetsp:Transcript_8416/g.26050  ORF Transcript_8416/g.26050 Transcript_8416/m.26050 type:complete len:211 (-) Transcript_8416:6-638(-)